MLAIKVNVCRPKKFSVTNTSGSSNQFRGTLAMTSAAPASAPVASTSK